MTGTIFFWRVDQESPMEGEFDLVLEAGQRFDGQIEAEGELKLCSADEFFIDGRLPVRFVV